MENYANNNINNKKNRDEKDEMITIQILDSQENLKNLQEFKHNTNENRKENHDTNEKQIISILDNKYNNYGTREMEVDFNHLRTEDINVESVYDMPDNFKLNNYMFLFINPRSGAEEGKLIFDMLRQNNWESKKTGGNLYKFLFDEKNGEQKFAYIFNIIDRQHYLTGCNLLNLFLNHSRGILDYLLTKLGDENIRVLIGGGDGTVLSIIEDLNHKKLNLNKCYFGHLPLGTGNDLSNALGFGGIIYNSNWYYEAKLGKIDVWILKLTVDKEKGDIIEFSQKTKNRKKLDSNVYKRSFLNYFSLGWDARVGFGFERKRSGFRCWNKFLYFWEGLKKNCCRRTLPLNSFLDAFMVAEEKAQRIERYPTPENENNEIKVENYVYTINSSDNHKLNVEDSIINSGHKIRTIFKSHTPTNKNQIEKQHKTNYKEIIVKGNPVNLICQNINFYMGGTKDIWKKSGKNIGLKVVDGNTRKFSRSDTDNIQNKLSICEQNLNDQKLEFFTYSSGFQLGFEKILSGRADKVYHGPGPILLKFKDTPEKNEKDKYGRVYLNIDGEYFHIIKPLELRVKLNNDLCNGSINFIMNK